MLILKAILDNVPFVELKRFARNGSRLFAMCEGEYDLPSSDEFPGNLGLARKLMANGYDVYMLGNPNGVKSAEKKIRDIICLLYKYTSRSGIFSST
ncbi:MAG: hypothetical protein MJY77_04495 [Bacteroidaceae bacterium]|nr:hypothetical protein [Bacteroidaceae bacterium]